MFQTVWYTNFMSTPIKKLYRSTEHRAFLGVLGGLGEYLELDPVLLRFGWITLTVFTGFVLGIVAYVFAAIIIPKREAA